MDKEKDPVGEEQRKIENRREMGERRGKEDGGNDGRAKKDQSFGVRRLEF